MYPNKEQLAQIVEASRIIVEPLTIQHNDGVGTIQFTIPENGVVEIKVS